MEIKEIKQQLSINAVLEHYGIKADKNGMANCPFHPDKTLTARSLKREQ